MECRATDSKKLFKVFDASRRRRPKKRRGGLVDDGNSVATDESNGATQTSLGRLVASAKASLQDMSTIQGDAPPEASSSKRERDSSPSASRSPAPDARRSPRRHRRHQREGISLALKPGHVSTPRSVSPAQDVEGVTETATYDQDSLIYAFLEDAIKRDKKKQRHSQRHDDRRRSRDRTREGDRGRGHEREASASREHRHCHRRRRDDLPSKEREMPTKEQTVIPAIDQTALFQTFAQICAQITEKTKESKEVQHTLSHKSLQCEVMRADTYDVDQRPVRLRSHEHSWENIPSSRVRSEENIHDSRGKVRSPDRVQDRVYADDRRNLCYPYEKPAPKYASKLDLVQSRMRTVDERYRDYPTEAVPTRSCMDHCCRPRPPERRDYRDYDDRRDVRRYEDDRKRFEQKTSRSFEVHRDSYEDERARRTARSDSHKKRYEDTRDMRDKRFDEVRDRRYDDRKDKYYDDKQETRARHFTNVPSKDRRSRRNLERYERNSLASRDEDYRDRDRYSERERDSGLSIADGENSTVSGRSNYLKVVKQEIAEQREAMDKMMKLWKELMRCFKGISHNQGQQDKTLHDSAANVQESAAAQLRLWRECMRRYETVARDVGDTDARLMEEISKQRSEMAEMANMWQECLQRYRDMSSDFNNLKQQLATSESPTRAPAPPLVCAEGEGTVPAAAYRMPHGYPPPMGPMPAGYGGSPLRSRASAPPAWWWCTERPAAPPSPRRRRSSPDSRGSRDRDRDRDRDRRHRHKERDDSRYKEKSSKPSASRSEHRHRKR